MAAESRAMKGKNDGGECTSASCRNYKYTSDVGQILTAESAAGEGDSAVGMDQNESECVHEGQSSSNGGPGTAASECSDGGHAPCMDAERLFVRWSSGSLKCGRYIVAFRSAVISMSYGMT